MPTMKKNPRDGGKDVKFLFKLANFVVFAFQGEDEKMMMMQKTT